MEPNHAPRDALMVLLPIIASIIVVMLLIQGVKWLLLFDADFTQPGGHVK